MDNTPTRYNTTTYTCVRKRQVYVDFFTLVLQTVDEELEPVHSSSFNHFLVFRRNSGG